MKEIQFGFSHMLKATPAFIGRLRMAMNFAIIGFIPYIDLVATEFNVSKTKMELLVSLTGIALNFLSTLFGVPIDSKSAVPAEDVTEIETK